MPVSDIVNVQITRETQTVSQAGFGTLMILGTHKAFNDKIRYYSNITEVEADFSDSSKEYIASQDVFAQSPRPIRLAIGRRDTDNATILVESAQSPFNYTATINGTAATIPSAPVTFESKVVLDADLVTDNYVGVTMNAAAVETVNTVVTFDIDFVTLNSITATVNGVGLTPVIWNTDQATTMGLLATEIQGDASVTSATVTDTKEITIVFALVANNLLDSVVTLLGASQPVETIFSSQFLFNTDHLTTITAIAAGMQALAAITTVVVSDANNRTLQVNAKVNEEGVVNTFTVNGGATQAIGTITTVLQSVTKLTIADALFKKINTLTGTTGVTATNTTGQPTIGLAPTVSGVPYTVAVSTTIINPNEAKVTVTQAKPATTYTVTTGGVISTFTTGATVSTNEVVAAGLVAAITANTLTSVSATDNLDGSFELTDSSTFSLSVSEAILSKEFGLIMSSFTTLNTITADLTAISNVDDDWYALASTTRDPDDVKLIAAWVETRTKIFGTASDDLDTINVAVGSDTTSVAAVFNQLSYTRSFVMYHADAASDFPECAWFGKTLPTIPGSITWKFKTLSSIAYNTLTTTQSLNARNKKANTYEFLGGLGVTREGTMGVGEFIDIIRGVDWLTARIQENVYSLLVNSPKVPYTSNGIATVEAEIRRALNQGVANDFIASDPVYTITVPVASAVSPANKAARLLQDVVFNATLAGAIHAVEFNGTVSL